MSKGHWRRPGKDIPVEDWASWMGTAYCFNCKKVSPVTVEVRLTKTTVCNVCHNVLSNESLPPKPVVVLKDPTKKIDFTNPLGTKGIHVGYTEPKNEKNSI